VKIKEGERERVQAYEGVCIARQGAGINESFTVRKISFGEGVERVFPIFSPMIESIEVKRRGVVRRAKLYYLRDRRGKSGAHRRAPDEPGARGNHRRLRPSVETLRSSSGDPFHKGRRFLFGVPAHHGHRAPGGSVSSVAPKPENDLPILLTGGTGQVGAALRRLSGEGFRIQAPGRDQLDLSDASAIEALVASRPWRAVISSGADTAVDKAEADIETAWAVNARGPAALAAAAARAAIPILHLSTDFVFAGTGSSPYVESDPIGPLGVYGASKAAGELAVAAANPRHLILRTAWVVSPDGNNFIKTMLRLAETRDEVSVVNDQVGCPTSADDIASALKVALTRLEAADPLTGPITWSIRERPAGMILPPPSSVRLRRRAARSPS